MYKILILNSFPCDWVPEAVKGSPENAYILNYLIKRGWKLFIIAPEGESCHSPIPSVFVKIKHRTSNWRLLRFLFRFLNYINTNIIFYRVGKRIMAHEKFDAIWSIGTYVAPAAFLLKEKFRRKGLLKAPGVIKLNSYRPLIKAFPYYFTELIAFSLPFDGYLLVDDGSAPHKVLERMDKNPDLVKLMPNPYPSEWKIDPERRRKLRQNLGFKDGDVTIGWASRYHPLKGIQFLPMIVSEILRRSERTFFLMAGFDPALFPIKSERVKLLGPLAHKEMLDFFHLIDIFILTNTYSCLVLPLIEASYLAIPTVSFDVGESHKAILDGKTGFLVRPFDTEEFVQKTLILVENKELRQRMGRAAREFALKNYISWIERAKLEENALRYFISR